MAPESLAIEPRSGFCASNSVFYSKRKPLPLPGDEFLDLASFVKSRPHSGVVAFIDAATGRRLTFDELWVAVDALAAALSRRGIRKGDVVLVLSPNSIYFPVVFLAVISLGAVLTTTNPLNTVREIAKQIADSNPVLAFTVPELVDKVAAAAPHLPVVLIGGEHPKSNYRIVSTVEEMVKEGKTGEGGRRERVLVRQDDTATLLYSSGTTGMSKGVVSSHRNLIAMVETVLNRFAVEEGTQTFICTVPMFHVYGLALFASGILASGSTIVVLSKFDLDEMLASIGNHGATYLPLVPPILMAMINHAAAVRSKYDLRSLRWVLSGGAPLGKEVIEGFLQQYPKVGILQGYGLTETTAIGASTDTVDESRRYGTAGLLSPNMEAKIVDPESGQALPTNRTGELWLRGPSVMKEYFSNAEATSSTLDSEGWLKTGDLCYIDDDGFIFVVDRLKELIKYKGYQVAPAELEALLLTHPLVADAAVIPFPDKEVGQYPMAYVVRKEGSSSALSEKEIMEFIGKQVAPYKKIRRVAFVSAVPKNPSGKILRKDLIKLATSKSNL